MANSVFKELEPDGPAPEHMKHALVAEIDTIRNVMQIVTHFTGHFLAALTVYSSFTESDDSQAS